MLPAQSMTALLMTTVVAFNCPSAFSALPLSEREGCPGAVDLSSSSRSSFGVEAVAGSSALSGLSTGRGIRSWSASYENSSCSHSGLRKNSGRVGYGALSSKLTNDVNQAASSMAMFSMGPEEFYSKMVTDVIENVEFDNLTLSETKHINMSRREHRERGPSERERQEGRYGSVDRKELPDCYCGPRALSIK